MYGKQYTEQNVLDAAIERYRFIFEEFNHVYFSLSGGKDSSVMLELADMVANEVGASYDVLSIHLEAQYKDTINHIEYLRNHLQHYDDFYWVCLPLSLRNGVSVFDPKWICWDDEKKDKWIRSIPDGAITVDNNPFPFFYKEMEFEEFVPLFARWYSKKNNNEMCACGIGIRSDESLNRFRTIISSVKDTYKDKPWTTRLKINNQPENIYNFYPIYDWRTEDIWGAVAKYDWEYNQVYEKMYKNNVGIHQQRLCQFFGDDQKGGLDQIRMLEPETWERSLQRMAGVNFGNIYARTSILGNMKSEKPEHMSWKEYSIFLLESLGLYVPELRDHYTKKIDKWLIWWENAIGIKPDEIPDGRWKWGDEHDMWGYSDDPRKDTPSWWRIARALERNDFWMKRLKFSQTKADTQLLKKLRKKYKSNLIKSENTTDGQLKKMAEELNGADSKDIS